MPWLTPEEVLAKQAAADYKEVAIECGAMERLETLELKDAFLHGWWCAHGMGNATPEAFNAFCDAIRDTEAPVVSGDSDG